DHRLTANTPASVHRYMARQSAELLRGGVGVGCVGETDVISCFCVIDLNKYKPGKFSSYLFDVFGELKALEQAYAQKTHQAKETAFGPIPTYAFGINRSVIA